MRLKKFNAKNLTKLDISCKKLQLEYGYAFIKEKTDQNLETK